MRFVVVGLLVAGGVAHAQELSPPPMPPTVTPEATLPAEPDERPRWRTFSSRISFFAPEHDARFDVSLGVGEAHCRAPCVLEADQGPVKVNATRNARSFTEQLSVPAGDSHVTLRSYSLPMRVVGFTLLAAAITLAVMTVVLIPLNPPVVAQILLAFFAPSVVLSVPAAVLLSVSARRPTMTLTPGFAPFGTPGL